MRQNVKRTIAFAETVAMIATLTVGITFGNATQVKADITSRTNNIHIDTSIPISSQGETVGYEFTVEKDGYYMLYTQGEDDTYGTLYVKEGTTWKELIHDDDGDDGDSNNFLLTATLYKDKEYKIDVREYDNNNFSTELFATEYTPIINGVNCSSNVYARVGDTVELKTYAEDQYGNYIEDLGDLGITYRWYMEDDETSKIDELGTGSSYTVNNVTEHIFNEVTYKVDWRYGEYNDTLEFYIYDIEYSYKINSDNSGNIYASQGESVSLNIKVENYKKEEVETIQKEKVEDLREIRDGNTFQRALDAMLEGGKNGVELGIAIIPGVLIVCTLVMILTFGPSTDPITGEAIYTGAAYEGIRILPVIGEKLSFILDPLFGFTSPEAIAFPITSLGTVGAAMSLVPQFITDGIVTANDIAVFTAMGMCWSGYLSTHVGMMDALDARHLTGKAIISHTIGGICAGISAHFIFMLLI